jgi:predicted DNA-binding transcriptional regulator AlpA
VPDQHDLLTTAEVAELTRAPQSTLRYWRHLGIGPRSFRLGRRVVYRRAEIERWIQVHELAATGEPDEPR